jgi:hypothetical protein
MSDNELYEEARLEFNATMLIMQPERKQNIEDRRFVTIAGAQWEGSLADQFGNKPRLECNKIQLALDRTKNEYRNNRITANFEPVNGDEGDMLADTADDMWRATERRSVAKEAYDNCFDEGTAGGFGSFRLATEFVDEYDPDNTLKNIIIEPIYDADSTVFFDLGAKRQDKLDATRCWVLVPMSRKDYEDTYDDDVTSWPEGVGKYFYDDVQPDLVYIAEYYVVEEGSKLVTRFVSLEDKEEVIDDVDDEKRKELLDTGWAVKSERKVKRREVHKYIMGGSGILSDEGRIAGKYIPIIPFYGKRSYINNIERCSGRVRLAKDMQRLKNMQISMLATVAASAGSSVPVFTPDQMAGGNAEIWAEHNIKNYSWLPVSPVLDKDGNEQPIGAIAYTQPAVVPPATAELLRTTDQDIKDVLGDPAQGEKIVSNISGETVDKIQDRIDMVNYGYMDNFARSIETAAFIWLWIGKEIFTEEGNEGRMVKGITSQGTKRQIELMRDVSVDGKTVRENDFSKANMELTVDVGPSSSTKREATVKRLSDLRAETMDPQDNKILTSLILMNSDGEGLNDVRDYYRNQMVSMGVVKPTEDEQKAIDAAQAAQAQEPPSPEDQFMLSEAEKNTAEAQKTGAQTIETLAKVDKTEAETAEINAKTGREDENQTLELLNQLNPQAPMPTPME